MNFTIEKYIDSNGKFNNFLEINSLVETVRLSKNTLYLSDLKDFLRYNFKKDVILSCINDFNLDINAKNKEDRFFNFASCSTYDIDQLQFLEEIGFDFHNQRYESILPKMNKECIDFLINKNINLSKYLSMITTTDTVSYYYVMDNELFDYILNFYIDDISNQISSIGHISFDVLKKIIIKTNIGYSYIYIINNLPLLQLDDYQFIINNKPNDIDYNELLNILLLLYTTNTNLVSNDENINKLLIRNRAEINYNIVKEYNLLKININYFDTSLQHFYLLSCFDRENYIRHLIGIKFSSVNNSQSELKNLILES